MRFFHHDSKDSWRQIRLISLTRHLQAQRLDRHRIERGLTVLFRDYAEATRVIPHRPSDIVTFESGADVAEPARTVVGVGLAIDAELVADQWNAIALGPVRCLVDFGFHARGVPVVLSVTNYVHAMNGFRNGFRDLRCIFRS